MIVHLQSQGCVQTSECFCAHTQNGQLEDSEEQFAEFDKKQITISAF